MASSPGGKLRPITLAVLRLITNSNLVGCKIGRSAGLLTLKNPAGVDTGLAICVGEARSIAHQAAGFGKGTQFIDRRHPMVGRQRNDVYATVVEQRAGTYQQRINRLLAMPRNGCVNVAVGGG